MSPGEQIEHQLKCANERDSAIRETKQFRVDLDGVLSLMKAPNTKRNSRERSLAITKVQEAIMWLGMDLKDLGTETPYPNSYNPGNNIVDPTADGLKL